MVQNVAKTLLQSALIWTLLLWLGPSLIRYLEAELGVSSFDMQGQTVLGWSLFALASSLGLWSGLTLAILGDGTPLPMDTASKLVVRVPFKWVRNPMAVAGLSQGVSVGGNPWFVGSAAICNCRGTDLAYRNPTPGRAEPPPAFRIRIRSLSTGRTVVDPEILRRSYRTINIHQLHARSLKAIDHDAGETS